MTVQPLPLRLPARRAFGYRKGRGWWISATAILAAATAPPLFLVWQLLTDGIGFGIPVSRLAELMVNTVVLAVAVTATSLGLATTTAWLTTRTDLGAMRFWSTVVALPLVIPSYMAALTIIGATGPGGMLAETLGVVIPTPYGFLGSWLALSLFLTPMAHLIIAPGMASIDPSLEEAARGLGARPRRVFTTVTLPQLRPSLVSAGLMVGLYTIADFGAVSLLRFDTFTRAIFTLYAGQIDRRPASFLSLVLIVVAVAIILIERARRGRARFDSGATRRRRAPHRLRGVARKAAYGILGGYVLVALVIPVSVLIFWLTRGLETGASVGGIVYEATRSVGVSTVVAVTGILAAFPLAMVTTWRRRRASGLVETGVWSVYSLPHITVGVAVVGLAITYLRPAYQTLALLVAVYTVMFMAQAMSSLQDSLLRASPTLEDASRSLGRGPLITFARVTLPLTTKGIVAGAALLFLSTMKELPATLLLRPTGFETLAIRIWSSTSEGFFTNAAAASLTLLAVSVVPLLLLTRRDLIS